MMIENLFPQGRAGKFINGESDERLRVLPHDLSFPGTYVTRDSYARVLFGIVDFLTA